jgi:hypothetical protein
MLSIAGLATDLRYTLSIQPGGQIDDEMLQAGEKILFHHSGQKWRTAPKIVPEPPAGGILLGAIPGLEESTRAELMWRCGQGSAVTISRLRFSKGWQERRPGGSPF